MEIINISAYKFADVPNPLDWRSALKERGDELGLLGSILLAPEGINCFLAGARDSIDAYMEFLRHDQLFEGRFTNIEVKESITDYQPFKRMVVRIKKEIITMKHPMIRPADTRASAVDAKTLKKWLDQGHDDNGREVVLLDTRNQYEVDIGTFNGARSLNIDFFSEFPQALQSTAGNTKQDLEDKTIVSFCTGGIRCEKAVLLMREENFEHVYQLDGGILRYFEEVGGEHWSGECFVFDRRVALDPQLQATTTKYEVTAAPLRNSTYLEKVGQENA
ncbi:MAG: sulfurtransferase [Candidatus Melainabacteria bacterium]|nr:sulfurtransferase [Candidatus Melainabacteria bacterium]